jgi:N-acetylglucosamine-6-phosphate deacetylase
VLILAGGDLVLPDRILTGASLLIDEGRIAAIEARPAVDATGATVVDVRECFVVPGFIDVHVHGVEGFDTLDEGDPVGEMARRLPRYGVTAFCPTTVACGPAPLRALLRGVTALRSSRAAGTARVLPAHLESNFINPEYKGAQPAECLRMPPGPAEAGPHVPGSWGPPSGGSGGDGDFSGQDILDVISTARPDVGIVTLAPELPGAIELVTALVAAGHRVSIGHSGATLDEAMAAIDAGARHATHLFNRMAPMSHRAPGIAGAVLAREDVAAELICDGYHVHPAMAGMAIAAKGTHRMMGITDGTAGSGLTPGSTARLGGRRIRVTDTAAVLDEGTLAGSTLTMDRAFKTIVTAFGLSIVDAATLCASTPARELGLTGFGVIARDAVADLVVLDRAFRVRHTFIAGEEVYARYRGGAIA